MFWTELPLEPAPAAAGAGRSAAAGGEGGGVARRGRPLRVLVAREGRLSGRFALLAVTTLERMLLASEVAGNGGRMKLVAIDERPLSLLKAFFAGLSGKLGTSIVSGVHVEEADEISIEGDRSHLILDGEMFCAEKGRPILLQPAAPLSFVRLAA